MAKDLSLIHLCPHLVVGEWLAPARDRKILRTVKYTSNSKVKIKKNGILIPKEGLVSTISLAGSSSQPFTIEAGVNDELKFSLNEEPTQVIKLPTGIEISAQKIAQRITEQANGILAEASNGRLRLETAQGGPDITLFLKGGSSHSTIGFPDQRFYQGREIVPPWGVVKTPNTPDSEARHLEFVRPLKTNDDIFEVSYYTQKKDCRRCQGLGIEHDVRHNSQGVPEFITGVNLLAQEVEKIVFTIRGSNLFYTWYGTSISDLIGTKIIQGGRLVETQLVSEISQTLENYRNLKLKQSKRQPVGDQEFLLRVRDLTVRQDNRDPTIFRIRIALQNRADQVEELQKTLVVNESSLPTGVRRVT